MTIQYDALLNLTAYRQGRVTMPESTPRLVVLGNFDGVHLGHCRLISEAARQAKTLGLPLSILTFEPHPADFFASAPLLFRLTPTEDKIALLIAAGADEVILAPFTQALASLSAEDFINSVLINRLKTRHLFVGQNFRFGAGRKGDISLLQTLGTPQGMVSQSLDLALDDQGRVISSSAIRDALRQGHPMDARDLLGRPWSVRGPVVNGAKRGRSLSIPTANQLLAPTTDLKTGVYVVTASVNGQTYGGASNWGRRPQFDNGPLVLETHLFDFNQDIYGSNLEVFFHDYVREERAFIDVDTMVAAIHKDFATAKALISKDALLRA